MPGREAALYQRGKYWLDWDIRADGSRRTPFLTIFWYDPAARRVRSASTRTADETEGMIALDRRFLADRSEAPAFCHACGQPIAHAAAYLLNDAIADYRLEKGDGQSSADTIAARLKHATDFLVAEEARGPESRFGLETSCAIAATPAFAEAFRTWSKAQPVTWRNRKGEVTVSRQRAPATTEESITQLAAVLNHAVDRERSDKRPAYRPLPRKQVSRPRRTRIGVPELAAMLAYAAEPKRRRGALHAFLVASICTIARPEAVVDIAVAPDRGQWWPGSATLDLNPQGRTQTKKHRAVVPVLPVLREWLAAELAEYQALDAAQRAGRGWLVNYYGRPVLDVDGAWESMLVELKLPTSREWRSYLLRHSLATLVRNRGASHWDLAGYMGHRLPGQTETYAVGEFPTVVKALSGIISELEELAPGALHRNSTGASLRLVVSEEAKMTG